MIISELNKAEALRYMGHKGDVPPVLSDILDKCEKMVLEAIKPAYVYREASLIREDESIKIADSSLCLTGNDIARHLKGCDKAIIFAATLSSSADTLIRRLEAEDMAMALAADALCSAAVEQVCDIAEKEFLSSDCCNFHTRRFSAGYGDLPVSLQKDIVFYLNAQRRIGLTVTENYMMIPRKSVTAIIGISDNKLEKHIGGCAVCNMRDRCDFSKCSNCDEF